MYNVKTGIIIENCDAWKWYFTYLHAGSPTVSKNRQVPPFMQKSPAIGQGCSCRGHAAVAVIKKLYYYYMSIISSWKRRV